MTTSLLLWTVFCPIHRSSREISLNNVCKCATDSICIEFFKDHLRGLFQTFTKWRADARILVPNFVEVDEWLPTIQQLADFANLANTPPFPYVTVQGEAGVGKTRLVCEAMARLGEGASLLLYTNDQDSAVKLAKHIAAQADCTAILIADECGLQARVDIENVLTPHKQRVRAVCIDNSAQRPPTPGPEVIVAPPPASVVEKILEQNFAGIPTERRRAFAGMSGSFVRLAVDLCQHNELIPTDGDPSQLMTHFHDHYLSDRLTDSELRAVSALSLLTKVGFKAEMETELDQLCQLCNVARAEVLGDTQRMKDAPGFVAFAGRFLYVTPAIIARTAFLAAWQTYISIDVDGFLRKIPDTFIDRFSKRVEQCGTDEMKQAVSDFFGYWTNQLTQQDLADKNKVRRLVQLVEIQPERFLSVLRGLVTDTPLDKLREMHTTTWLGSGPRRQIVWFCERAVIFPEYFAALEEILFRLSLAESEPNLGNNATNTWLQLFRVYLSGTAIPFSDRFAILRRCALSGDDSTVQLALKALGQAIKHRGLSRMAIPPVVMGRVPSEQWHPATQGEQYACWQQAVDFMVEAAGVNHQALAVGVKKLAIANLRVLLLRGFLEQIRKIINPKLLPAELRPRLHEAMDHFFEYDADPKNVPSDYLAEIQAWKDSLQPSDFSDRLVVLVGQDTWHRSTRGQQDEKWKSELDDIARQFIDDPELLDQHHQWLCSEHARSAFVLGQSLGKEDGEVALLERVSNGALTTGNAQLAAGYIRGLLQTHPAKAEAVNAVLDQMRQATSLVVFELIAVGGDEIRAFDRVVQLVEEGRLGAEYLRLFAFGVRQRPLTDKELCRLLDLLNVAVEQGNERAANVGIHLLWTRVVWRQSEPDLTIFSHSGTTDRVKQFLSLSTVHLSSARPYWDEVLEAMLSIDAEFVIDLAVQTLLADDRGLTSEAEKVLASAAKDHAVAALRRLTPVLADSEAAWRFRFLKYDTFVKALPPQAVAEWLDKTGVEGARALARSLPGPFLNEAGQPVVPEPTLTVLSRFGNDDIVFEEFCIGLHSLQVYSGDIAAQHEQEAAVAQQFLNHDLSVICRWAQSEIADSKFHAQRARQEQEEFGI